ncbi:hypothetical protein C4M97_02265 [Mycoplasmopsis pullorum]|uniref:RNA-binding domain-containing protein n=1 Tax=Mycoplasmopsis pullorum TaxID=48003 RepID=UPI0011194D9F|nr:hypothetical protein C4M94_02425 [Mycoplasmopsis pullorum]TNK83391.1 hypothetical protein C4M80_00495 [Mycoplasmopsis pullorum]TNK85044.1 hypothetical protein C4M81_00520 [Mycoplasmopsis pullorum]TNK85287.1 hypothetical protein C4M92_01880 [Mycoplasmopsis pullorum]TNK86190.1 hypothetical protein C4M85_00895 [Mycoplasmopsis pullorum]
MNNNENLDVTLTKICGLLNKYKQGTIYIGIKPNGYVTGTQFSESKKSRLITYIQNRITLSYQTDY